MRMRIVSKSDKYEQSLSSAYSFSNSNISVLSEMNSNLNHPSFLVDVDVDQVNNTNKRSKI